jgi:uncharacterized membrane protein YeaQ/YmgE (transglycosylase-associated protein family)
MGIIVLVILGGVLGWLAGIVVRRDAEQGPVLNIVTGIVGALIAGLVLNPLIGGGNILAGDLSAGSLLVSLLGAVVFLALINLVTRTAVR